MKLCKFLCVCLRIGACVMDGIGPSQVVKVNEVHFALNQPHHSEQEPNSGFCSNDTLKMIVRPSRYGSLPIRRPNVRFDRSTACRDIV